MDIATVAAALQRDEVVGDLLADVGERPVAKGAFGVMFAAVSRETGQDVLIKVNAAAHERVWMPAIHTVDPEISPAVFGTGATIDDLALPWIALERLPFAPPGLGGPEWYPPLMRAAFRWHDAAAELDLPPVHAIDRPLVASWIDDALELDETAELLQLRERFDDDWAWVSATCSTHVHHGDVHFFNAGSRTPGIPDTLVLYDPIPREAPWPYDAANCHTLTNYGDEPSLVRLVAEFRRARGLPTPDDPDVDRISALFCAWLALMWRVLFKDVQPDRRVTSWAHVERAVRR